MRRVCVCVCVCGRCMRKRELWEHEYSIQIHKATLLGSLAQA